MANFLKTQESQRVMNVASSHKWTLAAPCVNQGSDRVQVSLSSTDEIHLIPNGACENIVYTQPECRELMEEKKICIVITMSFSNSLRAVHRSYLPPIFHCSYSKLKYKPLPNYRSTNVIILTNGN